MNDWALILCGFCLTAALVFFGVDAKRRQREELLISRMRAGAMYQDMYPLIEYAREHDIDRVRIERNRVTFYGVSPAGKMGEFSLAQWNYKPLNNARTWALTMLLAEDLPILQSSAHYKLRHYKVTRPNGTRDDGYMYIIRSAYKTSLAYTRNRVKLY